MVKVGFLGTGLMGQPMAQRLLDGEIPVVAYNRTSSKLEPLRNAGAETTDSAADAIAAADCVILMLADANAIRQVALSDSCQEALKGRTVIQMGTISPRESQDIQNQIVAVGGEYLEAPVLGSIPQVKDGKLQVMVGASEQQFQKWQELLKNFGEPLLMGPVGTAAATKLALNQLIAALTAGFALSLGFVQRQGVDVDKFMELLRDSALYAPTFDKKLNRMQDSNFADPNFPLKHLLKDINLFLSEAKAEGLEASSLAGVRQVVENAQNAGLADEDYSSLYLGITQTLG
ncbi:NAD(P)-dependent oxidoreductase [Coleofasciculus chthonoplastes]|uniref:NAD(P)-dependent oxidoreductase n=1 Tax=Coleofasciculus chthonoplastes TaxID=64178 RepID=UPI0032F589DC